MVCKVKVPKFCFLLVLLLISRQAELGLMSESVLRGLTAGAYSHKKNWISPCFKCNDKPVFSTATGNS